MQWLGRKRVAFIPVFRSRNQPPDRVPDDFADQILRRVLYNPMPQPGGPDRSLRGWLRAASSGRADIDPAVLPMQTSDANDTLPADFEGVLGNQLRSQGFDHACIVLLSGNGASNAGFWSRVLLNEGIGRWAMEIIHGITDFPDLYHYDNDVDPKGLEPDTFDEMSAATLTHPTIFTKTHLGWADPSATALHAVPVASYELQLGGLPQPPVARRVAAVRIGSSEPYMMIEARTKSDAFDASIASEGVIAYRVQWANPVISHRPGFRKPVYMLTKHDAALQPGQSAVLDNGVTLTVTDARVDGFAIRISEIRGEGLFVTTDGSGNIATLRQHTDWDRGWDLIIPGNFGGSSHTGLLFYKRSTGEGLFAATDGSGNIATLRQHTDWDRDWDLIIPGNFGGSSHTGLLFYKRSTGMGLFASTDGNGNIGIIKQHTDWDRDWDVIIPGNFGGSSHTGLLFYKRSTGEGLFAGTDGSGNIATLRQHTDWDRDWDLIIPGNFGGSSHTGLLFYKRSTGEGLFASTDASGNIATLRQHADWDRDWNLIVPGNFGGSRFTDLLFSKHR